MLLSSVLSKVYIEKDINANLITISSENYSSVPLNKGIEFIDPYNNKKHVFNKNYIIKRIINNVGIMNGYYKTIQKFVTNQYQKNKLKDLIKNIVNKTNFYFYDLPKSYLGVTICNGDIFISGKYLQESLHISENNRFYNFTAISKMFLTILHEIAHKIQYLTRMKYYDTFNSNYFIKTFLFKDDEDLNFDSIEEIEIEDKEDYYTKNEKIIGKLNDNEISRIIEYSNLHKIPTKLESGEFFDDEIYLGSKQLYVTKKICEFFLLSSCKNYKNFIIIMNYLFANKNNERTRNSNFKMIEGEPTICYHSYIRSENNYI